MLRLAEKLILHRQLCVCRAGIRFPHVNFLSKMADAAAPPAADEGGRELIWPETGEKISKNEWKRRVKQQEKDKASADKAAARAAATEAAPKAKAEGAPADHADEEDPSKYFELRNKMLAGWQEKGVSPYPHKFQTSMEIPAYVEKYKSA